MRVERAQILIAGMWPRIMGRICRVDNRLNHEFPKPERNLALATSSNTAYGVWRYHSVYVPAPSAGNALVTPQLTKPATEIRRHEYEIGLLITNTPNAMLICWPTAYLNPAYTQ